jgi:hypothetical protein
MQPITDRGDPTDDFSAEPEANGRRINLGAFGGTAEAELSMPPPPDMGGGCSVATVGVGRGGRDQQHDTSRRAVAWALFTVAGLLTLTAKRTHSGGPKRPAARQHNRTDHRAA